MRDSVYNLFVLFSADGLVRSLGAVAHEFGGSDDAKLKALQTAVASDLTSARVFPVPSLFVTVEDCRGGTDAIEGCISFDSYAERFRDESHLDLFEDLLQELDAPPDPLVCITPVLHGEPVIDGVTRFGVGPLV